MIRILLYTFAILYLCQPKHTRLLGAYRPTCTPNGLYAPKQCHGSTGFCWCVTPTGTPTTDKQRNPTLQC